MQMEYPIERNADIKKTDIAVIGMSCRFPGASTYEEFWENLQSGKSSVEVVPASRWDWKAYWGDPQTEKNKSNSKWGGFLKDVDCFDPDFFGISAKEVERMDPQQRIMLELTWACFEDAGIRPADLSGKKVGVFLGVFNFDYKELQERSNLLSIEAHHSTGTASALIANRISYYFNLKGPSLPIDTACSSSLSAIHSSIQSLLHGECTLAVAGGINLLLTPTRHISFSKTGMLSPTGSCKTFDDNADGYVRGEGAGLVLLKPLEQAIADKDNIYGIIKGSAVNHGGKTYSLTYPNPQAQKEVIIEAQKMAGITADTISYIEAHGTGTPKGDPIEFQGLTDAFQPHDPGDPTTRKINYCGLGSVKTNVGHLEAAAGIAGIIKVLLSMKYQQLPGLQHFTLLNHRISLENSPFYLVTGLQEWKTWKDINNKDLPRRAGVSSFGFGGTNAHVVVEEGPPLAALTTDKHDDKKTPYYLVCITAKNNERLLQKVKDLAAWLGTIDTSIRIEDICKTLSVGREHFQQRTAIIVNCIEQLKEKLDLLSLQEDVDGCFRNLLHDKREPAQQIFVELGNHITETLDSDQETNDEAYYRKLVALAELYLKGYEPDWERPWFGCKGRRVGLPAYPFSRQSYWIPELSMTGSTDPVQPIAYASSNPLTSENTAYFPDQRFSTTLTGNEFYIKDHVVKGRRVLPAVGYLEMARAAVMESAKDLAIEHYSLCLKNIIWAQPVIVGEEEVQIHTALFEDKDDAVSFEIFSEPADPNGEAIVYSQGIAMFENVAEHTRLAVDELQRNCSKGILLKEACYRSLGHMGFDYGPAHQGLEVIYTGTGVHLAKLSLPAVVTGTLQSYYLHPALMDAALQACLLVDAPGTESGMVPELYLPFALENLEIIAPCTAAMWAVIRRHAGKSATGERELVKQLDIELCDGEGNVCARLKGLTFKLAGSGVPRAQTSEMPASAEDGVLLLQPDWKQQPVVREAAPSSYVQHLVFLCEPGNIAEHELKKQLPEGRFIVLQGAQNNIGQRFQSYTRRIFEEIQSLLKDRRRGKILVQIVVFENTDAALFAGLSGLLKTARLENPDFTGQLITVSSTEGIVGKLQENGVSEADGQIRYINGSRHVAGWKEVINSHDNKIPWKEKGVYLIIGGAGGLGLIFAKEITEKIKNPSLILTGRSPLNESKKVSIEALRAAGAHVEYRQVDVSNKKALAAFIQDVQKEFTGINGIIHSAGIVQDNFIIRKSNEEVMAVLSPKVLGVTYLDEVTKEIPLDFFILFSSIVGAVGNTGQADYAAANAYLDEYAAWRNSLAGRGERYGHTLAINWPLWKGGGMQLKKEMEQVMLEQMQMSLLETAPGIQSLYRAMNAGVSQIMVAPGNPALLRKKFLAESSDVVSTMVNQHKTEKNGSDIASSRPDRGVSEKEAIQYFKKLLSVTIKRPVEQIEADAAMEAYGIDSIMVMQMTNQLETVFGTLPKTLFFEYQNIQELTHYFLERYTEKLREILGMDKVALIPEDQSANATENITLPGNRLFSRHRRALHAAPEQQRAFTAEPAALDIAIIGIAGRYPQANNLREFWDNLRNGKDCITEIPGDRWDYRAYFDEDKEKEGKSYSKWGGFLNDVDKFDPLFFNISPLEAERMDPQERLFLQCVYEAMEDAGYTRHSVSPQKHFGLGNQVGVYVGVMYEEYQLFGAQEMLRGNPVALWGLPSSIANRVSYYCDFHGPSMAVDTMCSSSLTAIHLACESIIRGKCNVAIAGGVNVSVHPNKYLFLSQGRFVSSKGRCESFGIGGDGYVPGEGVGAVLLKPLEKAIADGDNIYGVIKSTAINHGGKTNGYTVPNPKAQSSAISRAFKEAGIDPRMISYLEAHGTGTSLGDPIEIAGLSKTMQEYTSDTQFCTIGSVKSNIGHCESAAGIAGVTKVLLQMKYRQIVPSLHSATLNPHIDFVNSPFVVQQKLSAWERPVSGKNGQAREHPLCAGISSFGAGGANAHIVIEEYIPNGAGRDNGSVAKATDDPAIILLSAMDEERLEEQARQLLAALKDDNDGYWKLSEELLADMAYTLQMGREHLETRLALLVTSIDELRLKLADFLSGKRKIAGIFQGQVNTHRGAELSMTADEDIQETVKGWLLKKKYEKVIERWIKGAKIDWKIIYEDRSPLRRISMPTYPFKKDRYWVGEAPDKPGAFQPGQNQAACIHPLLHENISDLTGQRFRASFSGYEFYLKDHVVNGQKILPAAAYLEMISEAIWQSVKSLNVKRPDIQLKNIKWIQPILVEEKGVVVDIELHLEENGEIGFEVYSSAYEEPGERETFSTGTAAVDTLLLVDGIGESGINTLQKACSSRVVSKRTCYEAFEKTGFQYGLTHQGIEQAYIGEDKILAKIALPSFAFDRKDVFLLHPGLMDAALQASLLWNWTDGNSPLQMYLPVAAECVEIYAAIPAIAWVVIGKHATADREGERVLDMDVLTEAGEFIVRLKGISFKAPSSPLMPDIGHKKKSGALLLFPEWEIKAFREQDVSKTFNKQIAILCGFKSSAQELASLLPEVEMIALEAQEITDFKIISRQVFETVQALLKGKEKGNILLQVLVPDNGDRRVWAGISGLLKTAQKENPRLWGQVIRVPDGENTEDLKRKIRENTLCAADKEVRYQHNDRQVLQWKTLVDVAAPGTAGDYPWKDKGVYLITGGTGGLGLIFAREIAQQAKEVTLVLTGRSPLDEGKQAGLAALQELGAHVYYKQADVTAQESVQQLIQFIHHEFGSLQGIIHSAGITRDNFLINKTAEEWNEVLAPKVNGIQYLDLASKDMSLDLFIFFSSISGAVGNAGQADYATANAFMDEYAQYRNTLVANGVRYGQTLSVNWPLWKEGGMHVDQETERYLFDNLGMTALSTKAGIDALYRALRSQHARVMVIEGDHKKILEKIVLQEEKQVIKEMPASLVATDNSVPEEAIQYFKKILSSVIKLPIEKIKPDVPLEEYGIDSVMVMKMTARLEKLFGSLSRTLFFEYQDIRQLTHYFWKEHHHLLTAALGIDHKKGIIHEEPAVLKKTSFLELLRSNNHHKRRLNVSGSLQDGKRTGEKDPYPLDIAIVGVSGRYPQADNLEKFWENLCQGKDCIIEVPHDRWDHSRYFDADRSKAGKTYSKWGGFLNGVDEFDPLFFNISPREAALLDPQERLFLQCAYETMEDAGYNRQALAAENGLCGNVGVYVGVMYEEYQLFGVEESMKGRNVALFGNPSSIANRVSYFYNLNGPSMAIDTMCSSSLTAIHLACQAIQQGDCKAAIAGGVNISIHPNKYLLLAQGKFVSSKGRCESFGIGGDGYVPGEGVGSVFLKPLSQAIADGDHVYGVIKATSVNHGGKTNGYTVPNPNAQAQVIKKAYQRSGIDPRTISYLEAHGTGTSLGDPIEITGLKKAYQEYTKDNNFCAIGSVKSNIGHGESAAGIAGVTKILLQLKHKQIAPSLHAEQLNPNIDFANSPFVVQRELAAWKRPVIGHNGQAREFLRRAGISSFGAGGSNAHVIIEEVGENGLPAYGPVGSNGSQVKEPVIILLSAKNANRLYELTERVLKALQKGSFKDNELPDIAFTLQMGREPLEVRLAIIVKSIEELCSKLEAFLKGEEGVDGMYQGKIERDNGSIDAFTADEELQEAIGKWMERKKYARLCDFWVKGLSIDWTRLYRQQAANGRVPRRVSLPTYPFAKERYWVSEASNISVNAPVGLVADGESSEYDKRSAVSHAVAQAPVYAPPVIDNKLLQEKTLQQLKDLFGQVVKLSAERIDEKEDFQAYGLNSVMIVQLNQLLEKIFGELSKTLFYEYNSLLSLTIYLVKDYEEDCIQWTGLDKHTAINQESTLSQEPGTKNALAQKSPLKIANDRQEEQNLREPIAIIGMSGRYPMANSLQAYWENLKAGKNCISGIPQDRWSEEGFFHPDKEKAIELGRSYSKWGGFLEGFADFDPLFFNISPREAITMDPQERIFLQACWEVLEDAGYTKERIAEQYHGSVGVFAGVTKTGFELYSPELWKQGYENMLRTSFSSIANRVSFHLNLHGPSMPIDTMCSASLTAIHEACENLLQSTCDMAIAGGVNLYLHPLNYIGLCSQSFLSTDGKCRSFGKGGSGFVPGEGVGAILLKRLSRAIADGDHIYAVVKGTSINHGGKTSGYTVPNPVAQADLIRTALHKAGVHSRAISYIEAHGTGTLLGDPIEITGLSKAFREDTADVQFCAIGSVKSNIGHLEAAAGIAGVTKIVLQMKHGMLVPSLHAGELNPNINFERSPFYVQQSLSAWNRPVVIDGQERRALPRIAGISSFGAGGANAHVIIEEYIPDKPVEDNGPLLPAGTYTALPALIVLSARDENRLKDRVGQLLEVISSNEWTGDHKELLNIAYTLQTGREMMEERLAYKVDTVEALKEKLSDFISGKAGIAGLYRGSFNDKKNVLEIIDEMEPASNMIDTWIKSGQYDKILAAWVRGAHIPWDTLYTALKGTQQYPQRIPLPAYPFAKTKYWLPGIPAQGNNGTVNTVASTVEGEETRTGSNSEPVQEQQWLFTKEEWVLSPIPDKQDWNNRFAQYAGKRICIIYRREKDREDLVSLLEKISKASGGAQPFTVTALAIQSVDVATIRTIRPEIVLFVGPEKIVDPSVHPVESDLSQVYHLSKCLMQAAWDDCIHIYYSFETCDSNTRLDCEALSGFFLSAMKENNQHIWKSIRIHNLEDAASKYKFLLREWLADELPGVHPATFTGVQYKGGQRFLKKLVETSLPAAAGPAFRKKGNYIVAGGMGYIGASLLEELAKKFQANLMIISRSALDDVRKGQCQKLEELGARVHYYVGDITDMEELRPIYTKIKMEAGEIHGVINLARAHDSKSIVTKSWESFYSTSQVKIMGTLNLDLLTQNENLDLFMLFASIGAYGARGDSDYAFSVAFQNAFARYRNQLKHEGKRRGIAVSQCWGPWMEDRLFPESRKKMRALGLDLIHMQSAFPLIAYSCSYNDSVIGLCAVFDKEKVKAVLGMDTPVKSIPGKGTINKVAILIEQWEEEKLKGRSIGIADIQKAIAVDEMKQLDDALVERIYRLCFENGIHSNFNGTANIAQVIRKSALEVLQIEDIEESQPFQHYGLDSIMAMRLSTSLSKKLQMEVLPRWLIEFPTLKELTQQLANHNELTENAKPIPSLVY